MFGLSIGNLPVSAKQPQRPMKLLNYFPYYMYDTQVSVIPDFLDSTHETQLFLSSELPVNLQNGTSNLYMQHSLNPQNPNRDSYWYAFGAKELVLPVDQPFFERSFVFRFDVLSARDEAETIIKRFPLLRFSIFDSANTKLIHVFYYLKIEVTKNTDNVYVGKVDVEIKYKEPYDFKIGVSTVGVYNVEMTADNDSTIRNFKLTKEFMKTKYKDFNFFSVLRPKTFMINVFILFYL